MKGYVARKGGRYYAVIYQGLDPVSGREQRRWYPAGCDKEEALALAAKLAESEAAGRLERSSLTVAVFLTQRWLPAKKVALRISTWDAYRRNVALHVEPRIGRILLRQLRADHLEKLYRDLLSDGRRNGTGGLHNKTVMEFTSCSGPLSMMPAGAGLIVSNPAVIAHAPKRRPLASNTSRAWTAAELRNFLEGIRSNRFFAAFWLAANSGMRRGEILGLRWGDADLDEGRLSVSRSLVSVGYRLHENLGKTRTARRSIDRDACTIGVLEEWRDRRLTEDVAFRANDPEARARPRSAPKKSIGDHP